MVFKVEIYISRFEVGVVVLIEMVLWLGCSVVVEVNMVVFFSVVGVGVDVEWIFILVLVLVMLMVMVLIIVVWGSCNIKLILFLKLGNGMGLV